MPATRSARTTLFSYKAYKRANHCQNLLDDVNHLLNLNEDSLDMPGHIHAMVKCQAKIKDVLAMQNITANPYVIADYGGENGRTSFPIIQKILGLLMKKNGGNCQFQLCVNDRPSVDFRALFDRYEAIFDSKQFDIDDVSISANGRSFYNQCFPDNSVHLGLSNYGLHWMQSVPKMENAIFFKSSRASDEERAKGMEQMTGDWEKVLKLRAKELAPGGLLCIAVPASLGDGVNQMERMWLEMRDKGFITTEEFRSSNIKMVGKTAEEIQAPFVESNDVYKSGLRCKAVYDLSYTNKYSSPEKQAELVTEGLRWAFGDYLAQGLSEDRRQDDRDKLMEDFYKQLHDDVLERRTTSNFGCWLTIIEKQV